MFHRKSFALVALAAVLTAGAFAADTVTLTMMTNLPAEHGKVLEGIANDFMAQNPGIKIDFSAPGATYEQTMKVKMAANDMPDLFSTHGWAKARYGNFLADLSGRPWAKSVSDGIKDIVTDASGKLYTLPFDVDVSGPIYNIDLFNQYGIAVPKTMAELLAAAETIKAKSKGTVVPFTVSTCGWVEAQFFDFFATPAFISAAGSKEGEALKAGTFDWKKYDELYQVWSDMNKKGYINKDSLTTNFNDNIKAMATGKAAIGFFGTYMISEAKKLNPKVNLGMMPIPAFRAGDTPTWVGGEKSTLGVWKDTKHPKEAMMVIDFFARPENVAKVAAFTMLPPGLKGVAMNAGDMGPTFEKYASTRTFPYFDREFLPNGMWDVMCKTSAAVLAGAQTPRQASQEMEREYNRLRTAAKS
jgi:raffinose/stachyose/melibiose transport system substrate-binding protein